MTGPRLALKVAAAGFVGFGLWGLLAPTTMLELVGVHLTTPAAGAEARAYYGGLELGFAIFLWTSVGTTRERTAALATVSIYLGCVGGRVFGSFAEGVFDPFIVASGLGEFAGAAATWWAYRRL